jgi:hypothetical protein
LGGKPNFQAGIDTATGLSVIVPAYLLHAGKKKPALFSAGFFVRIALPDYLQANAACA